MSHKIKVNFYNGHYQYSDPKVYEVPDLEEGFDFLQIEVEHKLNNDRNLSSPVCRKESFWATFHYKGEEMFEKRVIVNPENSIY